MTRSSGVLFCGGGTGGHVLPGLAVAAELRRRKDPPPLRWIGDPDRIEARLVPAAGIPLLPFGLSRPRPRDPRWLLAACGLAWRCWRELLSRPPEVVVALGGYASLLPGLLAPLCGRPLVVLEQNARMGRTNRLLAHFATAVVTQFPAAAAGIPHARVLELGNPVRAIPPRPRGGGERLRVLVVGGSLAARSLNDLVVAAAPALARIPGLEIVHLAGEDDRARVAAAYAAAGLTAEVMGFCHDMPALYATIDLAVTRAGATTVSELLCAGIGALYVPLPWSADDHQTANAQAVAGQGGAEVLPQATTTPAQLAARLAALAADRGLVAAMGAKARVQARPHAAAQVAMLVRRMARVTRLDAINRRRANLRQSISARLAARDAALRAAPSQSAAAKSAARRASTPNLVLPRAAIRESA
jgi:UDP-N-acetylglucosamine--N-acetylmuramyl-(pentapeptide) pyrophosphoryl-undecaprenol N-acetylglucosamine transferase